MEAKKKAGRSAVIEFTRKPNYDIADLVEIVTLLRSPGGCPWDREQTHQSIRKNLLEETYEVAEAIDREDSTLLLEELGDLLLQIALHTEMEREKGVFSFPDVADGICKKLIDRHPHVFGETKVSCTGDVLKNWDRIKQASKGQNTCGDTLKSVPCTLPALMKADKLQSRAAKCGFDYPNAKMAFLDLLSELDELSDAVAAGEKSEIADELGDVLFSVVNVARKLSVEPEEALIRSGEKFTSRFIEAESLAAERGLDMKAESLDSLNQLWKEAKASLKAKKI